MFAGQLVRRLAQIYWNVPVSFPESATTRRISGIHYGDGPRWDPCVLGMEMAPVGKYDFHLGHVLSGGIMDTAPRLEGNQPQNRKAYLSKLLVTP